ncbi:NYN domain-containing protein [Agrilactobacillus fermenti]|uniref:NYN domain-containing protein n=1 Tax=Agrilactobacillus fermenti TaxID=2586909 RepID=UPI001E393250|nr:NYN domain-containing protein [Agrilactobacillus fermenti]MCD2255424.1 NYN domain-containing protein [Agrilactobacillus fermenti]
MRHEILIVDGYNMIGNWPELAKMKKENHLKDARDNLLDQLSEYKKYEPDMRIILVFDAMYVPGIKENFNQFNIEVVYTQEDQTADSYIEALAEQLNQPLNQVTVATSDQAEQWTVFSRGALRVSAYELYRQMKRTRQEIQSDAKHYDAANKRNLPWSRHQLLLLEKIRDQLGK